uniref:Uncharacterized protein n=1 Tax=Glossina pallidipes TaxID=7398 RepID=A0A1B0A6K7_GLOPL
MMEIDEPTTVRSYNRLQFLLELERTFNVRMYHYLYHKRRNIRLNRLPSELFAPLLLELRGVLGYPLLPGLLLVIEPVVLLWPRCSSLLLFTISIGLLVPPRHPLKFSLFQPLVLKLDKPENEELAPDPNLTSTFDGIRLPKNCATLFCGGELFNTFWALEALDVLDILKV